MKDPLKKSLSLRTADMLKDEIEKGKFRSQLPSETALAKTLQVSRHTIREAFKILESAEIIKKAQKGSRRTINEHTQLSRKPQVAYVAAIPLQDLHSSAQQLFRSTRIELEQKGIECTFCHVYFALDTKHTRHITEFIQTNKFDLYVVFEACNSIIRVLNQYELPYVIMGALENTGGNHHSIAYDIVPSIKHAFTMALRNGHRNIILPYPVIIPISELTEIYASFNLEYNAEKAFPLVSDSRDGYIEMLEKCFNGEDKPTFFINTNTRYLITVYSWLASKGYKVPDDVAIVNIGSEASLELFEPMISYYSTNYIPIARRLAAQIEFILGQPSCPFQKIALECEFVARGSHATT